MKMKMILPDTDIFTGEPYEIMVDFKETEKSYIIKPISEKPAYTCSSTDFLYDEGLRIPKNRKSHHGIIDWGDGEYTIYIFRNGLPFYIKKGQHD